MLLSPHFIQIARPHPISQWGRLLSIFVSLKIKKIHKLVGTGRPGSISLSRKLLP